MATALSPEKRELELVGKVEMRIALADSDSKLSTILGTYLSPLLLKLASEHQSVRNKVISICQHVNTRVQPASVQLPISTLVKQFKEQESSLIRHFDFLYIQQGIGRISIAERAALLPLVVKGIASSGHQGPQVFNLLLRLLESITIPLRGSQEDVDFRRRLEVSDEDARYLGSWIAKLILYTPSRASIPTCPGLSKDDIAFLTSQNKDDIWSPAAGGLNLLRTKVLAMKLVASGMFNDDERFLPALYASADAASNISDIGDDVMKRALPVTDLEDEALVSKLFGLYFGTDGILRVRTPLRMKILALLSKSTHSTSYSSKIVKLIDDGIASSSMDGDDVVMSNGPMSSGASKSGRETTKLRTAVFKYINFVARQGVQDSLHTIAPGVVNRLRDFIENQGWPKPGINEDLVSRGYAYEVIGLLAKAGPRDILVEDDRPTLDLVRWLFSSLAKDLSGNAIIVSIEECLATILNALSRISLTKAEQRVLEDLLISQMDESDDLEGNKRLRSTRYVAVRFANRCLPYASVKARWADILGIGATQDRAEVREEATRGLSPYWYRMLNGSFGDSSKEALSFPRFEAVMEQFFAGRTISDGPEAAAKARESRKIGTIIFHEMNAFARRILYQEALAKSGRSMSVSSEWERSLDTAVTNDVDTRSIIKDYLRNSYEDERTRTQLTVLQFALFEQMVRRPSADATLIDFLALAPDDVVKSLVPETIDLIAVIQSNDHGRRLAAARAFGVLASHPSADAMSVQQQVKQLLAIAQTWSNAVGAAINQAHGALVTLGYYFSRATYRDGEMRGADERVDFARAVIKVVMNARDPLLKEASYTALGQLCMFDAISTAQVESTAPFRDLVDKVYNTAKTGNEDAIICLGQMSMILPEQDHIEDTDLNYVQEQLYKLHEIRQAEAHFSVGEAFSYVATGWRSKALATKLDIDGPMPQKPQRSQTLKRLVERILKDCLTTKPALKKAAVMWLLCLVQFCSEDPEIQQRLSKCQAAFTRCLSDRDELVQETASRGLGLVYEKGGRALKDDLVRELVSSFSSDKQSQLAGSVSADTQLFEPGALPTGDGSVSTYKDIMSLASEVGDSSLVYKFMSMASSNAIWSSRAAFGRFGLSNVLSDSSVDGYLANNPKLYPKLFRYRFDPNSGVQRSMNDIWNALVKDSAATIDQHFDAIMDDLLISILGKEWRVRQASCAAIADLVSGRPLEKYEQYTERIWAQCFKVLDDIKESVRAAAALLARTLTGVLTRALEADHSSSRHAAEMLKHVLPFLLSPSGMESSAKEVQAFAVHTLLEIIKKSSATTLRPFIPDLVERLIGLLSSLEPEAVNYIHLNASKYNLTEQKIDDMRLSSIRSSPLMEAVERCLDLLDEDAMRHLQPRLESAIKSAVGLPSKVGSSRVLVSLSTRRMVLFKPYANDFLRLIEKQVVDRNETVASSYAVAAGYVARGATDKQLGRLINFAKQLYFESEGDRESTIPRRSIASGEIMSAFTKHASDRFNSLASSALPFVFVAKHDPHEQVKEQFQTAWETSVGGSRAVVLYLDEILNLCSTYMDSPQWALKHTSARAVAEATIAVCALESDMTRKVATQLWGALQKALSGKTWDGKEVVLTAFVKFVETLQESSDNQIDRQGDIEPAIVKIAIREAKRVNPAYRPHAVKTLGKVAEALKQVDVSVPALEVVRSTLANAVDEDAMDVDGASKADAAAAKERARTAALETLFLSINPAMLDTKELVQRLDAATTLVEDVASLSTAEKRALYQSLRKLFDRIKQAKKGASLDCDITAIKALLFSPSPDVEAVRLLRADALVAIFQSCPNLASAMKDDLQALRRGDVSPAVRDRLDGCESVVNS